MKKKIIIINKNSSTVSTSDKLINVLNFRKIRKYLPKWKPGDKNMIVSEVSMNICCYDGK